MSKGLPPAPQVELTHRPREGGGIRCDLRGHQQYDLDQSRLGLCQRLPEPRAHAARDRAGGSGPRACRPRTSSSYNVRNSQGQLVPLSSFATVDWARGPTQIVGFNYYPSVRISGSAKPGYTSGRRHRRDGAARQRSCRAASASTGPASRCRRSCRARRRRSCSRSRRWWCSSAWRRSTRAGRFRSPCC